MGLSYFLKYDQNCNENFHLQLQFFLDCNFFDQYSPPGCDIELLNEGMHFLKNTQHRIGILSIIIQNTNGTIV